MLMIWKGFDTQNSGGSCHLMCISQTDLFNASWCIVHLHHLCNPAWEKCKSGRIPSVDIPNRKIWTLSRWGPHFFSGQTLCDHLRNLMAWPTWLTCDVSWMYLGCIWCISAILSSALQPVTTMNHRFTFKASIFSGCVRAGTAFWAVRTVYTFETAHQVCTLQKSHVFELDDLSRVSARHGRVTLSAVNLLLNFHWLVIPWATNRRRPLGGFHCEPIR